MKRKKIPKTAQIILNKMLGFIELIFKLNQQTNQLQNHPKFIMVVGRWAGGAPHNPRTRNHGLGGGG